MCEIVKGFKLIKDETNEEVARFRVTDLSETSVSGDCYTVSGWDADSKAAADFDFFSNVFCKWDACTHWRFYGEDFEKEDPKETISNYYHICGADTLVNHVRCMLFIWNVVTMCMKSEAGMNKKLQMELAEWYESDTILNKIVEIVKEGYSIVECAADEVKFWHEV